MPERPDQLLSVEALVTGYGRKQVLGGVDLAVRAGEVVALIGHNGAGKSTLLKAVYGLLPIWKGRVALNGTNLPSPDPRLLLQAGVAYVPQGNRVFTDLTVRENLELGSVAVRNKRELRKRIDDVLTQLPALKPRLRQRAATLSGGEKQMLALANGLLLSPRVLLLDEPSLGLAPPLVTHALTHIRRISESARIAVLVVEQKVREVLKIAQHVYVLRNGLVSFSGPSEELLDATKLREVYM